MIKKISELYRNHYGQYGISAEPTAEEIEKAVRDNDVDCRAFQLCEDALHQEWLAKASSNQEYCDLYRQYNARRIAYFVLNGWTDPISLDVDGKTIKDGSHRFLAAIHLNYESILVQIRA